MPRQLGPGGTQLPRHMGPPGPKMGGDPHACDTGHFCREDVDLLAVQLYHACSNLFAMIFDAVSGAYPGF